MSAPAPLLVSERLELWQPRSADRASLFEIVAPEPVHRYLGPPDDEAAHFARFLRNAGSWWLYGYGSFVVRERGQAAVVGVVGVFHSLRGIGSGLDDVPEAGWIIAQEHWGKGYAVEAMRSALGWFDANHGPVRIACMIAVGNAASLQLADKLGFVEYGQCNEAGEALVLLERAGRA